MKINMMMMMIDDDDDDDVVDDDDDGHSAERINMDEIWSIETPNQIPNFPDVVAHPYLWRRFWNWMVPTCLFNPTFLSPSAACLSSASGAWQDPLRSIPASLIRFPCQKCTLMILIGTTTP